MLTPVAKGIVRLAARPSARWAMLPALVMAAICLPFAGRRSLWLDESVSWSQGTVSWSGLVEYLHGQDLVFAPYYGILHVWLQVGQTEMWLRLPSLLAAVATVWMVALLGQHLWGARLPGMLAGSLLAVHPTFVAWALEARPYTLATLAVAASAWYLTVAGGPAGRRRHWIGYVLASALGGYLHVFTLLVIPVHVAAQLAGRRFDRRAAVATGALMLLVAPLAVAIPQRGQVSWIGALTWQNVADGLAFLVPTKVVSVLLLLALVALATRLAKGPDQRFAVVLTAGWGAFPVAALMAVSTVHPIFQERYVLFAIPGICLAAGGGWSAFFPVARAARVPLSLALGAITAAYWAIPLAGILWSPYVIDDYKGLGRRLDADRQARRIVVSPPWVANGVAYYERKTALATQWRTISKNPHTSVVLERLPVAGCAQIRVLLRSDLRAAPRVAAGQGCRPGATEHFGDLTLVHLQD